MGIPHSTAGWFDERLDVWVGEVGPQAETVAPGGGAGCGRGPAGAAAWSLPKAIQWQGDQVQVYPSTQDVTHYAGSLAPNLKVPIANIHVKQDHIGGGFGSKFAPDSWGEVGANLSQKAGGRQHLVKAELSVPAQVGVHDREGDVESRARRGEEHFVGAVVGDGSVGTSGRPHWTGTNTTQDGSGTCSTTCPAGVRRPVLASTRNSTMVSEFWLAAKR